MATVRINSAQARVVSVKAGVRLVTQVLYEVEFEAKIMAAGGPYSAGYLSESIEREGPTVRGTSIFGSVGSDLPYAASVHDGAEVHAIFPKSAPQIYEFGRRTRPQLKFFWKGRMRFFPHIPGSPSKVGISHPGIKSGKKYLTEPLRNAARRHRMRVITF
jgi:hypothetical protein